MNDVIVLALLCVIICIINEVYARITHHFRGQCSCPETQQVLNRLAAVEFHLCRLTNEVIKMSDNNATLDQAVIDLDAAATSKITEDAVLTADAQAGLNEAADVAKVEGIVTKLNAETAAEQAAFNPAPPAPTTPPAPAPTPAPSSTTAS